MNNTTSAQFYLIFALILLTIGWKLSQEVSKQIKKAHVIREAQIERMISSID